MTLITSLCDADHSRVAGSKGTTPDLPLCLRPNAGRHI